MRKSYDQAANAAEIPHYTERLEINRMSQPDRKFYRVLVGPEGGFRDRGDYEWLGPPRRPWMTGPKRPPFFDAMKESVAVTMGTGFPPDQEMQSVIYETDRENLLRDFELKWPIWFVSDSGRRLLDVVAPDAVDYAPLNVRIKKDGVETDGPVYWYADIVRCEQAVDETRSELNWEGDQGQWYDPVGSKFILRSDLPNNARLFRLNRQPRMIICDDTVASALKSAQLSGVKCEPL